MRKKVIVSWSSGKDSALTLLRLFEDPNVDVVALFTTYFEDYIPFQATPLKALLKQIEAINLPFIKLKLPQIFPKNEEYQSLVVEALRQSEYEFDSVAFGDIFCNGIAEYRRSYIETAGWHCVFPLLGENSRQLADEIIQRNIKTFVCTVDTSQLSGCFVGRDFNSQLLRDLPTGIDPCGEDGEFHTFVVNAPYFSSPVRIHRNEINNQGRFHYQDYSLIDELNAKD